MSRLLLLLLSFLFGSILLHHLTSLHNNTRGLKTYTTTTIGSSDGDRLVASTQSIVVHGGGNIVDEDNDYKDDVRREIASLDFKEIYGIVKPWTMVPEPRLRVLEDALSDLHKRNVTGNIVECGVWHGGSAMLMMMISLRYYPEIEREFFLFDTFDGMPPPTIEDGEKELNKFDQIKRGNVPKKYQDNKKKQHGSPSVSKEGKWNYGSLSLVKHNIQTTAYPSEKIHYIKGKVEDTLTPDYVDRIGTIALLRCDTDFFSSTKLELDLLYDSLIPGGLLWIDDYCSFQGSRKATIEFFASRNLRLEDLGETSGILCGKFHKPM